MTKAIIYARYSPRPRDCDSIESQVDDLQDWCKQQGYEILAVCFDAHTSGTIPFTQRPGLAQALACLGRGDVFVVRNLNRVARSIGVGMAIEEEIERIGAQLAVPEDGGIQPTKRQDRNAWCMRVIKYLMSDMQRMEICDRTSRRMLQHQAAGRPMGGTPPYGYRRQGDELIEDRHEQAIISRVRSMAVSGYTPSETAAKLRREGIRPRGAKWHANTVRRILERSGG